MRLESLASGPANTVTSVFDISPRPPPKRRLSGGLSRNKLEFAQDARGSGRMQWNGVVNLLSHVAVPFAGHEPFASAGLILNARYYYLLLCYCTALRLSLLSLLTSARTCWRGRRATSLPAATCTCRRTRPTCSTPAAVLHPHGHSTRSTAWWSAVWMTLSTASRSGRMRRRCACSV